MNTDIENKTSSSNLDVLLKSTPVVASRRGHFWITSDAVEVDGEHYQPAAMYVSWEAPEKVTQPYPILLIHGGLMQSTEWMTTPDGRPGWQERLVESGYAVFNVDRVGHGRSHMHSSVWGNPQIPFSYESGKKVFFPDNLQKTHTQWPIESNDQKAYDAFIAGFTALPSDLVSSQKMDVYCLKKLLEKIGPSVVFTHSASGPLGWHLANEKRDLVKAIVSVEPMGPAFADIHGLGTLKWGWTSYALDYDKKISSSEELEKIGLDTIKVPSLKDLPIGIVSGDASPFSHYMPDLVQFLGNSEAKVEHLELSNYGIKGNGHGLIYEKNSDESVQVVVDWLNKRSM